jgi:hypothetical protein
MSSFSLTGLGKVLKVCLDAVPDPAFPRIHTCMQALATPLSSADAMEDGSSNMAMPRKRGPTITIKLRCALM